METSGCEPADLCEAFSTVILDAAIRDVDAEDYDNPMLCSEYVKEIYTYLRQVEVNLFLLTVKHYTLASLLHSSPLKQFISPD